MAQVVTIEDLGSKDHHQDIDMIVPRRGHREYEVIDVDAAVTEVDRDHIQKRGERLTNQEVDRAHEGVTIAQDHAPKVTTEDAILAVEASVEMKVENTEKTTRANNQKLLFYQQNRTKIH